MTNIYWVSTRYQVKWFSFGDISMDTSDKTPFLQGLYIQVNILLSLRTLFIIRVGKTQQQEIQRRLREKKYKVQNSTWALYLELDLPFIFKIKSIILKYLLSLLITDLLKYSRQTKQQDLSSHFLYLDGKHWWRKRLNSYLFQSVKRNGKSRNKPMHIWSINLRQKSQEYTMVKEQSFQ